MNNIGIALRSVKRSVHPKGFGGDRKAPEIGRAPMLAFRSTVTGVAESRADSRFAPFIIKKSRETALVPYSIFVQRRGRRLRAERGSASDFSELARKNCPRQG